MRRNYMKRRSIVFLTSTLLAMSLLAGCGQDVQGGRHTVDDNLYPDGIGPSLEPSVAAEVQADSAVFDKGEVIGHVYVNEQYGLKITLPEEWHICTLAEMAEMSYNNGISDEKEFTNEKIVEMIDNGDQPTVLWACNNDLSNPAILTIGGNYGAAGYVPQGADSSKVLAETKKMLSDQSYDEELKTINIGGKEYIWMISEERINDKNVFYGMFVYGEAGYNLMISVMGPDRKTMEALTYSLFGAESTSK